MGGLDDEALNALAGLAEAETGQNLLPEARYLYETRLQPLVSAAGKDTLATFLDEALRVPTPRRNSEIAQALLDKQTAFFRDARGLDYLVSTLRDRYAARRRSQGEGKVRIWAPGCGTGQEAFTLALLFAELPTFSDDLSRIEILGTDVWRQGIALARGGCFATGEVKEGLSARQLLTWFKRLEGGKWQTSSALRRSVRFRPHNLIVEPVPEGAFDAIVCRNVLSGMTGRARQRALSTLLDALVPGGFLLLGPDEHVGPILASYHLVPQLTDGLFLVRRNEGSHADVDPSSSTVSRANAVSTQGGG